MVILGHLSAPDEDVEGDEGTDGTQPAPFALAGAISSGTGFRSHPEIHLATGMISVRAGVELSEALAMLRAHAFASDQPLSEVALEVVSRKLVLR